MPPFVSERTEYSLRNAADISVLSIRTEIYSRSFFPSSVDYWNKLPLSVRSADSLSAFKQLLKSMFRSPEIPNYFVSGQRVSSVYHCRIRINCSNYSIIILNQRLHVTVVLRVRMLNTTFSSVIDSHSNGLVYSRPSVNFSLSVYIFSYTVFLISLMTTTLNFFHTSNILYVTERFGSLPS